MKPVKLVMSAFGPFADKAEVEFDKLGGQGLFLVSGDTGAGKTTIFDAISFALFGAPSGEVRKEENNAMLRSHYAAKETKTYVEFIFLHRGKEYFIRRNPQYMRPRLRGDGETLESQGAELIYPDGKKVVDFKKVTKAVEDILGIDWAQYKQIAMIAQGEFLKLLTADSSERGTILRKVFGTKIYANIQMRLSDLAKKLQKECEMITNTIFETLGRIELPEDYEEKEGLQAMLKSRNIYETETIVSMLNQIIRDESTLYHKKRDEYDKLKVLIDEKTSVIAQLTQVNALFDELEKAREKEKELMVKEEVFLAGQKRLETGKKALYIVKPIKERLDSTIKEKVIIDDRIVLLNSQKAEVSKAFESLKDQVSKVEADKPRLEELVGILSKRKQQYAKYEEIVTKQKEAQSYAAKLNEGAASHKAMLEECTALEQSLQEDEGAIKGMDEQKVIQAKEEAKAEQLSKELSRLHELMAAIDNLLDVKDAYKDAAEVFTAKELQYREAVKVYQDAEVSYFREQAGILAQSLEEGKPCPVCGSLSHPDKAKLTENALTKEKLEQLKERQETANKTYIKASEHCNKLKTEIKVKEEAILKQSDLFRSESAEREMDLADRQELLAVISKKDAEGKACSQELAKLRERLLKLNELSVAFEKGKASLELKKKLAEEQKEQLSKIEIAYSSVTAAAETMKKELEFESFEEFKAMYRKEHEEYKAITEFANKAVKEYEAKKEEMDKLSSRCQENMAQQKEIERKLETAKAECETVLNVQGFTDEAAYEEALLTESQVAVLEADTQAYKEAKTKNAQTIEDLGERLKGKEKKDISSLNNEKQELLNQSKESEEVIRKLFSRVNHNADTVKHVVSSYNSHKEKTSEYATIDLLAKTANGNLQGKAKLAFEQYVQAYYFEQVLNEANKRLYKMSNSQYKLMRKDDPTNLRKATGLELEIMDYYTGKPRSVKSLSGGESFKAALSLALGLSDVIQNFAGGIEVDAMFVDEGFGSLDSASLEQAIDTLNSLTTGNRLVGIISHVNELKERIDKQIILEKTMHGSNLKLRLN